MHNSNVIARSPSLRAQRSNLPKDTFTQIGRKTKCQHLSTKGIEGYDHCNRGRIDVELCEDCGEVLSRKVVR